MKNKPQSPAANSAHHSRPTIDEIVKLFRYGSPDERSWAGRWLRAHKAGLRSVATGAALRNIAAVNARRVKREQLLLLTPPLPVDDAALVPDILKQASAGISIEALNSRLLSQGLGWGAVLTPHLPLCSRPGAPAMSTVPLPVAGSLICGSPPEGCGSRRSRQRAHLIVAPFRPSSAYSSLERCRRPMRAKATPYRFLPSTFL